MVQTFPSVAIVILNYNGAHHLEQFLPSVMSTTYTNKRIIVADNASTDNSIQFLKEKFPAVELIFNDKNYGFAGGYNQCLKKVEADYYVLLNSDVEVTPGWVEPVIALMEERTNVAACQPKLLAFANKNLFEYAGGCGGWIDTLGYPFSRGRVFDICETDRGQYDEAEEIFWATGAAMFVKAKVFRELGGFDPFFFAHQEEIDLCWRMQLEGYKVMACPQSTVYHVGGGTLPLGERKVFLNFRNNLVMLYKNLAVSQRLLRIPFRMLLDWVSAFKALVNNDTPFLIGVCKAHWAFTKWIFSKKSANLFPNKVDGSLTGVYNGSVVWKYFIRGKKTFAEIVDKSSKV
ncbi:MAG: glycosyltransferase family 2 protein [Segetibacter sp.]|nr:glycosyltransferase family 2 protein [Segetibacter sp.]